MLALEVILFPDPTISRSRVSSSILVTFKDNPSTLRLGFRTALAGLGSLSGGGAEVVGFDGVEGLLFVGEEGSAEGIDGSMVVLVGALMGCMS